MTIVFPPTHKFALGRVQEIFTRLLITIPQHLRLLNMGRTTGPDDTPSRSRKGERGRGPRSSQSRTVMISKALSRLLRHQAVNEGVPITNDGWVKLDHLLAWKGLSSRNGVNPPPTIEEIWEVVEENEKKRFAVRWVGKESIGQAGGNVQGMKRNLMQSTKDAKAVSEKAKAMGFGRTGGPAANVDAGAGNVEVQDQPSTTVGELVDNEEQQHDQAVPTESEPQASASTSSETQSDTETARAISHYRNTQPPPQISEFQIRATQGHSIQTIASDTSLLTPITLDDASSIPTTCVHGTFYGAWPLILRSGGLKRMGRNHVHFASGPSLAEIGITEHGEEDGNVGKSDKVISGMRNDAQLLIYIDLKRCLEDIKKIGVEMLWWKSENGVILTEGVDGAFAVNDNDTKLEDRTSDTAVEATPEAQPDDQQADAPSSVGDTAKQIADMKVKGNGGKHKAPKSKAGQAQAQSDKLVPMKYWNTVVDVKGGNGVIWRQGEGIVKELPEALTSRGTPKSRGQGRGRGRGRGRSRS